MLAGREVNSGIKTGYEVRAEIVVTGSGKLYVNGERKITTLDVLSGIALTYLLVKHYVLLSEMDSGRKTQGKVGVETQLAQYSDCEAWIVVVRLGIPLLPFGGYLAIVAQLQILHVES